MLAKHGSVIPDRKYKKLNMTCKIEATQGHQAQSENEYFVSAPDEAESFSNDTLVLFGVNIAAINLERDSNQCR